MNTFNTEGIFRAGSFTASSKQAGRQFIFPVEDLICKVGLNT